MQFVKLVTSDPEVRWINLAQVSRVTLAHDQHKPLLAIIFDGGGAGSPDTKLTIVGGNSKNDKAIRDVTGRLDALSDAE